MGCPGVLSSRCGFARSCVRGPTEEPVSKSETRRMFTRARAGQADGKETDRKNSCEKGGEESPGSDRSCPAEIRSGSGGATDSSFP